MMVTLPFTEKKFKALSGKTQQKWSIKWLSEIYHGLISNRISENSFDLILSSYTSLLKWQDTVPPSRTDMDRMEFIEFISDAIHSHRIKSGLVQKDPDLLPRVKKTDSFPQTPPVQLDYHMALDGIRSLFNTGSIFRVCEASGFSSIILGTAFETGIDHPAIKKTSMGTSEWLPHRTTHDLATRLTAMKTDGYKIIGVETVIGAAAHSSFNWPDKGIIVLGNEEYGISSHIMRICDDFVHIPMSGRKNSINVACAASVIAFHVAALKITEQ